MSDTDPARQRETFDGIATLYDEVRPQVLGQAVDALWRGLHLSPGDAVVDVGCGSGQLTRHLVERGAVVTALEPGHMLGQICAQRVGGRATVIESSFEDWSPAGRVYRAVAARQAAHWIDPSAFADRAVEALVPGGWIGLLWYVDRSQDTPLWEATEPLYDRYLPDVNDKPPRTIPSHIDRYQRTLDQDPRFTPRPLERWRWTRDFDGPDYLRLLRTTSPVQMLSEADRTAFLDGHAAIIQRQGGRVRRHYETVLLLAEAG